MKAQLFVVGELGYVSRAYGGIDMNEVAHGPEFRAESAMRTPEHRPRVAVVVPNPCDPDYRVVKQAEYLARQGYEVRVFCTQAKGVPSFEEFNGVTYQRVEWHLGKAIRRLLSFGSRDAFAAHRQRRAAFMQRYSALFSGNRDR